jgi:hypothetical protein
MKSLLAPLVVALLGVAVAACGGSSDKRAGSTSSSTNAAATGTTSSNTSNNSSALHFGHAASAADQQAVTALLERYYAAAAAGDGANACSMIVSSLAEAIVEDYGPGSPAPSYLKTGTTCPAIMAMLFKHFHSQLTAELPKLRVTRVRLVGRAGFAILSFGTMPEREFPVGFEKHAHAWKVQGLIDRELP